MKSSFIKGCFENGKSGEIMAKPSCVTSKLMSPLRYDRVTRV